MDYHRIEKALALRLPRPGFGGWFIPRLIANLRNYAEEYGRDDCTDIAVNALRAYERFNALHGVSNVQIETALSELPTPVHGSQCERGGTTCLTREEVHASAKLDLSGFFESRHSIRDFSDEPIDLALAHRIVEMAMFTPSVCNRQNWRVYIVEDSDRKERALGLQNGNRGFADKLAKLLVVASEIEGFTTVGERNQCWIDGGMFAMSLVYAAHSLGLGTCCLNWSVERETDIALRKVIGIPDSQTVIMMIGLGHLPAEFRVAQSPRKRLQEIVVIK